MEAIKCPNCGSEKVQEITEEKYVCLACENVFLVHNLSKEFQITDNHITGVHEDLSKKLDLISENLKTVEVTGNTDDNLKVKETLFEAEQALQEGKFLKSFVLFKKYAAFVPTSCVGYEGMFRALTNDYRDDAGEYKKITAGDDIYDCLLDGTDVLKKALECEDADKESILGKFEGFYERSAATLKRKKYGTEEEIRARKEAEKENAILQYEQSVKAAEEKVKEIAGKIEYAKSENAAAIVFDNLSKSDRRKKRFKGWIPFGIILVLSVLFWNKIGLGLRIVDIIVLFFAACVGFASGRPIETADDELNKLQQELKEAEIALEELQKRGNQEEFEEVDAEDIENESYIDKFTRLIFNGSKKAISADELYKIYLGLEKPSDKGENEGTYELNIMSDGSNKIRIIKLLRERTGMSLAEANTLIDNLPAGITGTLDDLKVIQTEIISLGGECEIVKR